jgi:hypothetical protein
VAINALQISPALNCWNLHRERIIVALVKLEQICSSYGFLKHLLCCCLISFASRRSNYSAKELRVIMVLLVIAVFLHNLFFWIVCKQISASRNFFINLFCLLSVVCL